MSDLTKWYPDTCKCILQLDPNQEIFNAIKKCKLHKELNGHKLLEAVQDHNHKNMFNHLNCSDKRNERARSKNKT